MARPDSAAYIRSACEASLRRLGVETIDLYYAHRLNPKTPLEESIGTLAELVREGKVREVGASFCAYSPLGRGFLTGQEQGEALDAKDFRRSNPRFAEANLWANMRIVDSVRALAAEKSCTPAPLALAWLPAQGEGVIPIPGTKRIRCLDDNLGALSVTLGPQDLRRIAVALPLGIAAGERYTEEGMKGLGA